MNIQVLQNKLIDRQKWNKTLHSSPHALIYAHSSYLDVVCPLWQGVVLDDYRAIMPLPYAKKYGVPFFIQPAFIQKLGVFSKRKLSAEELKSMTDMYHRYFFVQKDIQLYHKMSFPKISVQEITRRNVVLNLSDTYEEIIKHYNENTVRNLKKATSQSWKIIQEVAPHKVIDVFKKTKRHVMPFQLLERLVDELKECAQVKQLAVLDSHGDYLVGAILWLYKNRLYYIFSSTADKARNTGAPHFLIDHIIKEHSSKNCIFDFEGSDDDNLARFYMGFGAKSETYYRYKSRLMV